MYRLQSDHFIIGETICFGSINNNILPAVFILSFPTSLTPSAVLPPRHNRMKFNNNTCILKQTENEHIFIIIRCAF